MRKADASSKRLAAVWDAMAQGDVEALEEIGAAPEPKQRAKPEKHEALRQRAVVTYLRKHLPLGSLVFAITNHSRSREQTFFLLSQGMLPGMTDLGVLVAGRFYAIEMKNPGGRLSSNQERVQGALEDQGVPVLKMCEGVPDVVAFFDRWGVQWR